MTSPEDRDSNAQIEAIQQARDALCVRAAELMAARLYVNRHDYDDTAFDKLEDLLVRVIDWKDAPANDFVVASQVWIEGVLHKRRPDTIGFVNGPLQGR